MFLGDALLKNGLLEVGSFQKNDVRRSFRLQLEMLPAYPELLSVLAEHVMLRLGPVDRLVCPADSVPLGVAVSLQTKIPLVYSRGKGEAPVQDWVGAYDVGHPVAMLCHELPDQDTWRAQSKQLSSVGLEVIQLIALVEIYPLVTEIEVQSLLRLSQWLHTAPAGLPTGATQAMLLDLEK